MKKNFFMLLAAAALVSCSTSEMNEPDAISGSLISLKSTTSTTDGTRAPFIGDVSATNPLTALVPSSTEISSVGEYTTKLHAQGTMTFSSSIASTYNASSLLDGSGAAFPTGGQFPSPGNAVNLFGLYPVTGWTLAANGASITFNGNEDVMGAPEVLVKAGDAYNGIYQTLAFEHLLTKLEVKFVAEAGAIATAGQIRLVEWIGNVAADVNLKNLVTYTPAADPQLARVSFAEAATAVKSLSFFGATVTSGIINYTDAAYKNQMYALTTTPTLQAYAMVTPITAEKDVYKEYFLRVTREGNEDIIPIDLLQADNKTPFEGNTAGHAFSVLVNYTKDEIKAVGVVTAWVENGEYVANVELN